MKLYSKKKICLISLFILILAVVHLGGQDLFAKRWRGKQVSRSGTNELAEKRNQVRQLIAKKEKEGFDVSEAKSLLEQSRKASRQGDRKKSNALLDKALALLEGQTSPDKKQPEDNSSFSIKTVEVELPVEYSKVDITELVPGFKTGQGVGKYSDAFKVDKVDADQGKVKLSVGSVPLYVKEAGSSGDELSSQGSSLCGDSPFGVHDIDEFDKRLLDLGACWVRQAGKTGMVWSAIEEEKGTYDWSRTDDPLNDTNDNNIFMVVSVNSFNSWDQGYERRQRGSGKDKARGDRKKGDRKRGDRSDVKKSGREGKKQEGRGSGRMLVKDVEAYQTFLEKAVKRYSFVKAWQIENEPGSPRTWADTPENYLELMKISYDAVKRANPEALVVMGGMSSPGVMSMDFWSGVFAHLKKEKGETRYFDVFDIHFFLRQAKNTENIEHFVGYIKDIRKKLDDVGYGDAPIWMTEMASYSGTPVIRSRPGAKTKREKSMPFVSETDHASDLLKLYVSGIANGVSRMYWVRLIEWYKFNPTHEYFDNTGLINNPKSDGESHEKLAYYSYKKLAEVIGDADLSSVKEISLGETVRAFRIEKNGSASYIVWADN